MQESLDPTLISKGDIVVLTINGQDKECTAVEVLPHKITFEDNNSDDVFDVCMHYNN